eukprot:s241_g21.t3
MEEVKEEEEEAETARENPPEESGQRDTDKENEEEKDEMDAFLDDIKDVEDKAVEDMEGSAAEKTTEEIKDKKEDNEAEESPKESEKANAANATEDDKAQEHKESTEEETTQVKAVAGEDEDMAAFLSCLGDSEDAKEVKQEEMDVSSEGKDDSTAMSTEGTPRAVTEGSTEDDFAAFLGALDEMEEKKGDSAGEEAPAEAEEESDGLDDLPVVEIKRRLRAAGGTIPDGPEDKEELLALLRETLNKPKGDAFMDFLSEIDKIHPATSGDVEMKDSAFADFLKEIDGMPTAAEAEKPAAKPLRIRYEAERRTWVVFVATGFELQEFPAESSPIEARRKALDFCYNKVKELENEEKLDEKEKVELLKLLEEVKANEEKDLKPAAKNFGLCRGLDFPSMHLLIQGFRAWVVDAEKGELKSRQVKDFHEVSTLPQQDPDASVTVKVKYSDLSLERRLNYKDAMIFRGMHGVVRSFPIVPGIDMAGVVQESSSSLFNAGDEVVLTGNKIGQHCDGGYSELCRVQAEWLECMIIGTAGFTAMQMVMELETCGGLSVANAEPVLVLGAAGGAGSMAVALLASQGYKVVASSRRAESLRFLAKHAKPYPFVLRGVRLLGIDATLPWNVPGYSDDPAVWQRHRQFRLDVWKRIEQALGKMHEATIALGDLPQFGNGKNTFQWPVKVRQSFPGSRQAQSYTAEVEQKFELHRPVHPFQLAWRVCLDHGDASSSFGIGNFRSPAGLVISCPSKGAYQRLQKSQAKHAMEADSKVVLFKTLCFTLPLSVARFSMKDGPLRRSGRFLRRPGWRRQRFQRQRVLQSRRKASVKVEVSKPRLTDSIDLLGDLAQEIADWSYPLLDEEWRCFAGYLPRAVSEELRPRFFDLVREGTEWLQPTGRWGPLPLRTAWMCDLPCTCRYRYGGAEVSPLPFTDWMLEIMASCMRLCGLASHEWPNSCNLNLYMDGEHSVGWHADDEALFQGKHQDCRIISLSLGQTRRFELRCGKDFHCLELKDGDLCTMEGLTQKYYKHRVPKVQGPKIGPRINLTWRWIVQHSKHCPSCAASATGGAAAGARRTSLAVAQRKVQQEQQRFATLLANADSEEEAAAIKERMTEETKVMMADAAKAELSLYTRCARRLERLAIFSGAQGREDSRNLVQLEGLTVLPNEDGSNVLPAFITPSYMRAPPPALPEMGCGGSRDAVNPATSSAHASPVSPLSPVSPSAKILHDLDGSDVCSEDQEPMPEEEVKVGEFLPLEVPAEASYGQNGYRWHAQIVADDFFHRKLCTAPGQLKPCRGMPHIKLSELLERLAQNERGSWILSGELNQWPGLTNLELVSITCKVRSVVATSIKRLWLQNANQKDAPSNPVSVLTALHGKKLRSIRATFRDSDGTSIGWGPTSPGFVLWYPGLLDGSLRHGTDITAFARSDSTCSAATATSCHFFTHRYAKATEGLKDRLIWHGAVLVEWSHGLFCSVVELAWLNGLGGYMGRSNWCRDKLDVPNKLFASMPSTMKAPWQQHLAEIRVIDVPAKNLQEFQAFLHEFSGSGDLPIAEQRFFDPYVAYTGKVHTQHRSVADILQYLLNYIAKNPQYEEARRNCQTFASDFFTLLTGEEAVPTQAFCRALYKPRAMDFMYAGPIANTV